MSDRDVRLEELEDLREADGLISATPHMRRPWRLCVNSAHRSTAAGWRLPEQKKANEECPVEAVDFVRAVISHHRVAKRLVLNEIWRNVMCSYLKHFVKCIGGVVSWRKVIAKDIVGRHLKRDVAFVVKGGVLKR